MTGGCRPSTGNEHPQMKTRAAARVLVSRSGSAARLDHSVDDLHLVAFAPAGRGSLRDQTPAAVLVAHDDLVFHGLLHVLLDLVSGETAAEGAEDGRHVFTAAASDLVS